jgi:hypothetical protein
MSELRTADWTANLIGMGALTTALGVLADDRLLWQTLVDPLLALSSSRKALY